MQNPNPIRTFNPRPRGSSRPQRPEIEQPETTTTTSDDTSTRPVICDSVNQVRWTSKPGPQGPRGLPGKTGAKGDKGDKGDPPSAQEIAIIIAKVIEQNPDRFRGPAGNDGTNGVDGADGKDFTVDDLNPDDWDKIAFEVLKRLPPFRVQNVDPRSGSPKSQEVYLGDDLDLKFLSNRPYKPES